MQYELRPCKAMWGYKISIFLIINFCLIASQQLVQWDNKNVIQYGNVEVVSGRGSVVL